MEHLKTPQTHPAVLESSADVLDTQVTLAQAFNIVDKLVADGKMSQEAANLFKHEIKLARQS